MEIKKGTYPLLKKKKRLRREKIIDAISGQSDALQGPDDQIASGVLYPQACLFKLLSKKHNNI